MEKHQRSGASTISRILWIIFPLVFSLGQLTSVSLPFQVKFSALDIWSLVALVSSILLSASYSRHFHSLPFVRPLQYFILVMHLSLLFALPRLSVSEILPSFLYILRFLSLVSLFVYVYLLCRSQTQFIPLIQQSLSITIFLFSVFGLAQYIFLPDLRFLSPLEWDPHINRLVGTLLDPGFTGIVLLLQLLYLQTKHTHKSLFLSLFVYLSLLLTYSRATYLSLAVVIILAAYYFKSIKFAFIYLSILFISIYLLPQTHSVGTHLERKDTIIARIDNWQRSLSIWQQTPLLGVGYNTYRYIQIQLDPKLQNYPHSHSLAGADSSLLLTLATTGIVGLALLVFALISLVRFLYHNQVTIPLFSIIALLVHSMFLNSLYYPWVLSWFVITLALALAAKADKLQ